MDNVRQRDASSMKHYRVLLASSRGVKHDTLLPLVRVMENTLHRGHFMTKLTRFSLKKHFVMFESSQLQAPMTSPREIEEFPARWSGKAHLKNSRTRMR